MGEVVRFSDPDADLERPKWFYRECENLAHAVYLKYRESIETCPFGRMTIDTIFEALSETPVRLMALKEGDDEVEHFIMDAAMFRSSMSALARSVSPTDTAGRE